MVLYLTLNVHSSSVFKGFVDFFPFLNLIHHMSRNVYLTARYLLAFIMFY